MSKEEIVRQYQEHKIGYDEAIRLLMALGYAEVRADNLLFEKRG